MTEQRATRLLSHIIPVLRDSWIDAWQDIKTTYNNPDHDNRCRSTIVQMQAVIHARRRLSSIPSVTHLNIHTRHLFKVDDVAILRLKKLDENLFSSNFPTPTAEAYDSQEELPGLEDLPRLTAGLVPTADWTDIVGIYLTYPKRSGENNWVLNITGTPVDITSNQFNFNDTIQQPERRFRPKRGDAATGTDGRAANI